MVSSAYVMKLKCEVDCAMSFTYIMKSKVPSIEPWGTLVVILPNSLLNVFHSILHIVFFPLNSF